MTQPAPVSTQPSAGWRSRRLAIATVLSLGLHIGLTLHFDPPSVVLSETPLSGGDFDTHVEQTWRVLEGLDGWGQPWVYDVRLLAGCPNGVIFDADNKGWELFTYGVRGLGVHQATAFNLFVWAAHLLLWPFMLMTARLFGLSRGAALGAASLASALWFFDSYLHWFWWVGTTAYAMAAYFCLLPLALFHRFVRETRHWQGAAVCALLAASLLIHPYTFFILVVPMGLLYLRAFGKLGLRGHGWTVAIVVGAVAANAYWLRVAFAHWHYIMDSAFFGASGLSTLPADFFGLVLDTSTTGIIATRTGFRFLALAAAACTLVMWWRSRDERLELLGVTLGVLLVAAYLGAYVPAMRQIQPYRFIAPAMFLATIPAALLFEQWVQQGAWRTMGGTTRTLVIVLALPAAQHLGSDVIYYFPRALPDVPKLVDGLRSPITATGYPRGVSYRHDPHSDGYWVLPRWIDAHDDGNSRVLIQNSAVGEQLAWKTQAEILGGYTLRNLAHTRANLFRRLLEETVSEKQLRRYLEAFAVRWIVVTFHHPWFDSMPELFEKHERIAGHDVYRTKIDTSLFERGSGRIDASTNRLEVSGTDPKEPLVLRYHWHEALDCSPDCRVERAEMDVTPVGFIRIPAPHPASFVVVNDY